MHNECRISIQLWTQHIAVNSRHCFTAKKHNLHQLHYTLCDKFVHDIMENLFLFFQIYVRFTRELFTFVVELINLKEGREVCRLRSTVLEKPERKSSQRNFEMDVVYGVAWHRLQNWKPDPSKKMYVCKDERYRTKKQKGEYRWKWETRAHLRVMTI